MSETRYRHYLREWRIKRGLTQADLAERLGTDKSMISRYEGAQRNLLLDVQFRLMEALDITPKQFFSHPDEVSIDAMLTGTTREDKERVIAVAKALLTQKQVLNS